MIYSLIPVPTATLGDAARHSVHRGRWAGDLAVSGWTSSPKKHGEFTKTKPTKPENIGV